MPWHEVYSPRSPTGVRQPPVPPYLYLAVAAMGRPPHARGGGVGWVQWMAGVGPGRDCTVYRLILDAKKPRPAHG